MDDYRNKLAMLRMAVGGMVPGYAVGGPPVASGPSYLPGIGYVDPATGAPLPQYLSPTGAAANGMPASAPVGQTYTPAPPQQSAPPAAPPQSSMGAGSAPPSSSGGGSGLSSILSNPLVGAALGAGLGALGGGGKGALAGAVGGPLLGANMGSALSAAQSQNPDSSLAALSARYLPLLAASYAGAFYKNPTAPQYGKPASQSASLETATPTGAPKPKPGSWYTYGEAPDFTLTQGHAEGGAIEDPMSPLGGSLSAGVAAPSETGQHYIDGPGDGTSDSINARLAKNEYVLPADVVAGLGNGSSEAGAQKLDNLRENVRKHRAPAMAKGKLPPNAKAPEAYMK